MKSIEEREQIIKARQAEERARGIIAEQEGIEVRSAIFGRRMFGMLFVLIFFGLAAYGGLFFQTVHGTFFNKFVWLRLLTSFLFAHVILRIIFLFFAPDMRAYKSVWIEITEFFRIPPFKVMFKMLIMDSILACLALLTPVTGIFQAVNAFAGDGLTKIEGPIISIESDPLKISYYMRNSQQHSSYRVIEVLNGSDQKKYRIDVFEEYFDKHKVEVGKVWKDEIYMGGLGVFYRKHGNWGELAD
jgi:hypothetical protein